MVVQSDVPVDQTNVLVVHMVMFWSTESTSCMVVKHDVLVNQVDVLVLQNDDVDALVDRKDVLVVQDNVLVDQIRTSQTNGPVGTES